MNAEFKNKKNKVAYIQRSLSLIRYFILNIDVIIVGGMFASGLGDRGSIPGQVLSET